MAAGVAQPAARRAPVLSGRVAHDLPSNSALPSAEILTFSEAPESHPRKDLKDSCWREVFLSWMSSGPKSSSAARALCAAQRRVRFDVR
jgi:hypothetical protein